MASTIKADFQSLLFGRSSSVYDSIGGDNQDLPQEETTTKLLTEETFSSTMHGRDLPRDGSADLWDDIEEEDMESRSRLSPEQNQ